METTSSTTLPKISSTISAEDSDYNSKPQCSFNSNFNMQQVSSITAPNTYPVLDKSPSYSSYIPSYQTPPRSYNPPDLYCPYSTSSQTRPFYQLHSSSHLHSIPEYSSCAVDIHGGSSSISPSWGSYGPSI